MKIFKLINNRKLHTKQNINIFKRKIYSPFQKTLYYSPFQKTQYFSKNNNNNPNKTIKNKNNFSTKKPIPISDPSQLDVRHISIKDKHLYKIIEKNEIVHPFIKEQCPAGSSLEERLTSPKRIYGVFNNENHDLLGFLSVALKHDNPQTMQMIWNDKPTLGKYINRAVFYSVNTIKNPKYNYKISVGRHLIYETKKQIQGQLPHLFFNTMSPLLKFRDWTLNLKETDSSLLTAGESKLLMEHPEFGKLDRISSLKSFLRDHLNFVAIHPTLKRGILKLSQEYLISTKEKENEKVCFDPVAQFHFSNGAELFDLCWGADDSELRISQSFGIMAQYRYPSDLQELQKNQKNFLEKGDIALNNKILGFL